MISVNSSLKDATQSHKGKGEKAPHFKEAVDKRLLPPEGLTLLCILSCPPLLHTREDDP